MAEKNKVEGTIIPAAPGFRCIFFVEDHGTTEEDIIAWRITPERVYPVTVNNWWALAKDVSIERNGVISANVAKDN